MQFQFNTDSFGGWERRTWLSGSKNQVRHRLGTVFEDRLDRIEVP